MGLGSLHPTESLPSDTCPSATPGGECPGDSRWVCTKGSATALVLWLVTGM